MEEMVRQAFDISKCCALIWEAAEVKDRRVAKNIGTIAASTDVDETLHILEEISLALKYRLLVNGVVWCCVRFHASFTRGNARNCGRIGPDLELGL